MIFTGTAIQVIRLESGIARLCFDQSGASVNVLNQAVLDELRDALTAVAASDARGLMLTSAKPTFVVGADITEFTGLFNAGADALRNWLQESNGILNTLEDFPVPTAVAINGMALGGGLEVCLAADFRAMGEGARIGFPEVNLGICPGFGGTVRAPRLFGPEAAIEWIRSGRPADATQALTVGAVDTVVADDGIEEAAEDLIEQALAGEIDFKEVRAQKTGALDMSPAAIDKVFEAGIARAEKDSGDHYPAAAAVVKAMHRAARAERQSALQIEHDVFTDLATGEVAGNLVQLFLNDQFLKRRAGEFTASARPVKKAAVLGAGIMGGGIAYQSALRGTPIIMKDIAQAGLDVGMQQAQQLLDKQVARGRMTRDKADKVIAAISPALDYQGFDSVDLVVEAVVENPGVKQKVLAEVEQQVSRDTVLTSNTSTIAISLLASALQRPENFCGMHFFNPVPVMPLVEVIRGEQSSEQAIATTVAYAQAMGKTPIVVNDCPGFLINRVLFPYFGAFCQLVRDGTDFREIDRVMEAFGWPMGPAYLLDVVGMDTAAHCLEVLAEGYPDRMKYDFRTAIEALYEAGRYGQKNGQGFYRYVSSDGGRPVKTFDESVLEILAPLQKQQTSFSDEEIRDRMMVALCLETVRSLEEGIVGSAIEADMGLILGLGYPRFRGGALRYIDNVGVAEFCRIADRYAAHGPLYRSTDGLRAMADAGRTFY